MGAKLGSAMMTAWPRASRQWATHSLSVEASLYEVLQDAGEWGASILAGDQAHLAQHFSRSVPPIAQWNGIPVREDDGRLLLGAVGWIVARTVQGLGGAIFPLAFGIIRDEFDGGDVARGTAWMSAVLGGGGVLGIVLAGPILQHLSYHWLFWVPLVVVVASGIAAYLVVPDRPGQRDGGVSWPAALAAQVSRSAACAGTARRAFSSATAFVPRTDTTTVTSMIRPETTPIAQSTTVRVVGLIRRARILASLRGRGWLRFPHYRQIRREYRTTSAKRPARGCTVDAHGYSGPW